MDFSNSIFSFVNNSFAILSRCRACFEDCVRFLRVSFWVRLVDCCDGGDGDGCGIDDGTLEIFLSSDNEGGNIELGGLTIVGGSSVGGGCGIDDDMVPDFLPFDVEGGNIRTVGLMIVDDRTDGFDGSKDKDITVDDGGGSGDDDIVLKYDPVW